jgi:hypothetical protein
MYLGLILGAAFVVSACAAQVSTASDKLMDELEQQVRLPTGASPLQDYARHYAFEKDGKVIGIYLLRAPSSGQGLPNQAPDDGCEVLGLDGDEVTGKPVPCTAQPEVLAAGKRRWFSDFEELPIRFDGGCGMITVRFNPATRQVEEAFCNGFA